MKISSTKAKAICEEINAQTAMLYCFICNSNGCTNVPQLSEMMHQTKRNTNYQLADLEAGGYIYRLEKGFRVL